MSLTVLLSLCVVTLAASGGALVLRVARETQQQRLVGAGMATAGLLVMALLLGSPAMADEQTDKPIELPPQSLADESASADDLAEIEARLKDEINGSSQISLESSESRVELVTKDQPDWLTIEDSDALVRHQNVVASKLYFSTKETEKDLDQAMREAVGRYVNNYLKDDNASMLIRYDARFIRKNLLKDQFDEVWDVKLYNKKMYRRHALLDFNDSFRSDLDGKWRDVVQTSKLLTTGLGAFGLLGLLGVVFTYLRLDTATKGYYSGRLQFLAAVAILALSAAGVLFANVNADWLRWM